MIFGKKRAPKPLGYTVLEAGDDHYCGLPHPNAFAEGAVISCDECGRTATLLYNGFVGKYWQGAMVR